MENIFTWYMPIFTLILSNFEISFVSWHDQVEIAVSDIDFERRAGEMDLYDALVLDPWTWAGKGQ